MGNGIIIRCIKERVNSMAVSDDAKLLEVVVEGVDGGGHGGHSLDYFIPLSPVVRQTIKMSSIKHS